MSLFQDFLSNNEVRSITDVLESTEYQFDKLVKLSGLDPGHDFRCANLRFVDFRGADLRGFDFSGSDLRYSLKDDTTTIDSSTLFTDCTQQWVTEDEVPTVQLMLEARDAKNAIARRRILERLVAGGHSATHINKFLLQAIEESTRIEAALDFADYLVGEVPEFMLDRISRQLSSLIVKRISEATRRTRNVPSARVSAEQILQSMEDSKSEVIRAILYRIAAFAEAKTVRQHESFKDSIELSLGELAQAVTYMGDGLER